MKHLDAIMVKKPSERSVFDFSFIANQVRQRVIEMVYLAKSGHPGAPLGLADIYTLLYFKHLKLYPRDPLKGKRDRFLISNGHVCAVRYACMALAGFFDVEELKTFRKLGSKLQGHPSTKFMPEVENSSGSLGQGLGVANGVAMGLRLKKNDANVYVSLSDGECQEGSTWEAAAAAAHYKSDNLIAFVDHNNIQIDGYISDIMDIRDLEAKFKEFGWMAISINGHIIEEIDKAFEWAKKRNKKPKVIIFDTIMGKNVDFMENDHKWHGVPPNKEQYEKAMQQLKQIETELLKK